MKRVDMIFKLVLVLCSFCVFSQASASAVQLGQYQGPPSPIGFTDPTQTSNLMSYRLPTWGYRSWNMGVDFDARQNDRHQERRIDFLLETGFDIYHESERWTGFASATLGGNYKEYESKSDGREWKTLHGTAGLQGDLAYYVHGDWSVDGRLGCRYEYHERRIVTDTTRWQYNQESAIQTDIGLSYGRIRTVTPVVRAQRISERFKALGRRPLTESEIMALADILAQESGYQVAFDRSDKVFWQDVLGRFADDRPLAPFEVMYLTEVMAENLGSRKQGWRIGAQIGTYRGDPLLAITEIPGDHIEIYGRWSYNPSLNHQFSAFGGVDRIWGDYQNSDKVYLGLTHQWSLSDRFVWRNSIRGLYQDSRSTGLDEIVVYYSQPFDSQTRELDLHSRFDFYLEDSLVLTPSFRAVVYDRQNHTLSLPTVYDDWADGSYYWMARLTLTWYLDRVLS